jgi:hypothetical protein
MNNKRSFISRLLDWMFGLLDWMLDWMLNCILNWMSNWGILIFPAVVIIIWLSFIGIIFWVVAHFVHKYW